MAAEHLEPRSELQPASLQTAERVVCLFIPHLAVGGSERQVLLLARHLPREGYRTVVVTMETSKNALEPFLDAQIRVHVLPRKGRLGLDVVSRLRDIVRGSGAELVHAWLFAANWRSALLKLVGCRVPVVLSVRSMENNLTLRHDLVYRLVGPLSDAIMTNSRIVARHHAHRSGCPLTKYHVIANGVDVDGLEKEADEDSGGVPQSLTEPVIGFVGRLVERKRVDSIVRSAPGILSRCAGATFLIVGDGPSRGALEMLARELHVRDRFIFAGSHSRVGPFFRRMSVFVSPGYGEGTSNALLEAMALGVPVVAVASDGNTETVQPDVTGLLVQEGNEVELRQAVLRIVTEPELAQQLAREARDRIRREYSLNAMARRTADLYRHLTDRARG